MSLLFHNDYFDNEIPDNIYRKLNKDRGVNYHFRSDNVGKCSLLYDDFRRSGLKFTKKNWEKYYFKRQSKEPLIEASDYIKQKYKIDLVTAKKYVHFRVIGQTWNGMINEENIIKELEKEYLNIYFLKTEYEKDEQYFTDWEAWHRKTLLFGIQIKPISYSKMFTPYQLKAKENHKKQSDKYSKKYGVPHIIIYYENKKIHNKQSVLDRIDTIMFYKSYE